MKHLKKNTGLFLAAIFLLFFAACGGGGKKSKPPKPPVCSGDEELVNGVCRPKPPVCSGDEELVNGVCRPKPPVCSGDEELVDGVCRPKPPVCSGDEELVNGVCRPKPPVCSGDEELVNGVCRPKPPVCSDDEELVNGVCRPKPPIICSDDEELVNGVCRPRPNIPVTITDIRAGHSGNLAGGDVYIFTGDAVTVKASVNPAGTSLQVKVTPVTGLNCPSTMPNSLTAMCTATTSGVYTVTVGAAGALGAASAEIVVLDGDTLSFKTTEGDVIENVVMNDNEKMVVDIVDAAEKRTAFLLSSDSNKYTPIIESDSDVYAFGINANGMILGRNEAGYFLTNGADTPRPLPGKTTAGEKIDYWALSDNETLVGAYKDAAGKQHGFVLVPGGNMVEVTPAGVAACSANKQCGVVVTTINGSAGLAAGYYVGAGGIFRGFVYDVKSKTVTTTNILPAEYAGANVIISGINDDGHLVGWFYYGETDPVKGFIKAYGKFKPYVHYNAAADGYGTYLTWIGNSGNILGWFDDGQDVNDFWMENPLTLLQ